MAPRSRGYGDVTATYIHRSELPSRIYTKHVQARIRVRTHIGNIHSNRKVQVHGYHRKWYNITGILHHQKIQKYNTWRDIWKLRGAHEQQEGSREPNKRGTGRKSCGDVQASAAVWPPRKDPLRTPISYSKAIMVQALESGHDNLGLSDTTPRVHIIKPSGVHIRHMCTGKVYHEYKHIWTWNETVSKVTTGKSVIFAHIIDLWD